MLQPIFYQLKKIDSANDHDRQTAVVGAEIINNSDVLQVLAAR